MTREEILESLSRAERKLSAYVGVCKGDKELTETVLPMVRRVYEALSAQPAGEPFIEGWQTKSYESGERPTGFLGPQPAWVVSEETIEADFVTANMIHEWRLGARKAGAENDARFSELTDREIANGLRCAIRIYGESA